MKAVLVRPMGWVTVRGRAGFVMAVVEVCRFLQNAPRGSMQTPRQTVWHPFPSRLLHSHDPHSPEFWSVLPSGVTFARCLRSSGMTCAVCLMIPRSWTAVCSV
jgi:hypothetical protein